MKKYAIMALAVFMIAAFTLPAYALENEFGGFWDARFRTSKFYDGLDRNDPGGSDDTDQNVESRTRLYYTAKINDNLKLVNKFEMDATWGGQDTYGDVGADEVAVEVKNTYADFNTGPVNWTVGTQYYDLFRSYQIASDASGVIGRWKIMDNFILAASWLKAFEGTTGQEENGDIDAWTMTGAFWFSENISIKPSISWTHTSDLGDGVATLAPDFEPLAGFLEDADIYSFGADFDMSYDNWGLWVTAVGQTGTANTSSASPVDDIDFSGYLFAVGGNVMAGMFDIYFEGAYASGNDPDDDADEYDAYFNPTGSHVWSELLADGDLWNGAPGQDGTYDVVTNLYYIGGGVKFSPMDKLTINPSVWYASRVEDNELGDDELGTEVDMVVSYQLVEGLNLQLIGAYLFAGDAFVSQDGIDAGSSNEEDAYEYGMRLSLSF